jgi:dipeptidyl aminopeptidase/acylaminoacyl peptidase
VGTDVSENRRTIGVKDLFRLKMASDAQISPDGSKVVYVQTWLDEDRNEYRSSLFLVSSDGGPEQRLTSSECRDSHPRWSPDGNSVAFLSDRGEKNQIYVLPVSGGEPWRLAELSEGVTSFCWSPDGSSIALVSRSDSDDDASGKDKDSPESDVVRITSIRYRANGTPGFLDGKRSHIWCASFPQGDLRQITRGDFDDSNPCWTPGGREIVFQSDRSDHRELGRDQQIWLVNARGGEPRLLAGGENDSFGSPVVAPDSRSVAFSGHRNAVAGGSINIRVWTSSLSGEDLVCLTENLDRPTVDMAIGDFTAKSDPRMCWDDESESLLTQVSDQGSVHLYRVPRTGDRDIVISGKRRILDFTVAAGKIAFVASTSTDPGNVYVSDIDGTNEQRLTQVNDDFLSGVSVSVPDEFRVPSQNADNWDVHGWIMTPPNMIEGAKYPLVLQIHGGPHLMFGESFFHEFQTLASEGYVVAYCNPRGSQGYGEEFSSCTRAKWGESDMPDVMAVVDHAISLGFVDENRVGVTGGSYGGFLTNWVIGHTDRFSAAITDRCVSNLYSMYGTSDIGYSFGEFEFGGLPWAERETFMKYSPITYVDRMTTPLLIVHSEQDYRCPIEQAEQLFVSLKKLGRTVEFVRFPNENHELSRSGKPKHRMQRIDFNLDWWRRHL